MESEHNYLQTFADWADLVADFLTAIASLIAISVVWFKGKKIGSAINLLLRFSSQVTLSELYSKLDELDRLKLGIHPEDKVIRENVVNTFKALEGQITGNAVLKTRLSTMVATMEEFTRKPSKMVEWKKTRLTSELREQLRDLNIKDYHNFDK